MLLVANSEAVSCVLKPLQLWSSAASRPFPARRTHNPYPNSAGRYVGCKWEPFFIWLILFRTPLFQNFWLRPLLRTIRRTITKLVKLCFFIDKPHRAIRRKDLSEKVCLKSLEIYSKCTASQCIEWPFELLNICNNTQLSWPVSEHDVMCLDS